MADRGPVDTGFCLKVYFKYMGREFTHIFTPGTSHLRDFDMFKRVMDTSTPFEADLCQERLEAEYMEHRRQNLFTSWMFERLDFDSENWLNEFAEYLPNMPHVWVQCTLQILHP